MSAKRAISDECFLSSSRSLVLSLQAATADQCNNLCGSVVVGSGKSRYVAPISDQSCTWHTRRGGSGCIAAGECPCHWRRTHSTHARGTLPCCLRSTALASCQQKQPLVRRPRRRCRPHRMAQRLQLLLRAPGSGSDSTARSGPPRSARAGRLRCHAPRTRCRPSCTPHSA